MLLHIWLVTKPQKHACLKLEINNYFSEYVILIQDTSFLKLCHHVFKPYLYSHVMDTFIDKMRLYRKCSQIFLSVK